MLRIHYTESDHCPFHFVVRKQEISLRSTSSSSSSSVIGHRSVVRSQSISCIYNVMESFLHIPKIVFSYVQRYRLTHYAMNAHINLLDMRSVLLVFFFCFFFFVYFARRRRPFRSDRQCRRSSVQFLIRCRTISFTHFH